MRWRALSLGQPHDPGQHDGRDGSEEQLPRARRGGLFVTLLSAPSPSWSRTRSPIEAEAWRRRAGRRRSLPRRRCALRRDPQLRSVGPLEPQVACPHRGQHRRRLSSSPSVTRAIRPSSVPAPTAVLEDLEVVHRVLAGRHVAAGTRLLIVPASSEVFNRGAADRGLGSSELMAGRGRLRHPAAARAWATTSACWRPAKSCISTANRNFQGRMGTA